MTAFIIEKSFARFSHGGRLDKLGMRGSNTYPLFFDNCEVPENVLGGIGAGVKVLMSASITSARFCAADRLASCTTCMAATMPYMHERKQFGQGVGEFQLMQGKIADMYSTWQATRAYVSLSAACANSVDRYTRTFRKDIAWAMVCARKRRRGWPARRSGPRRRRLH